MSIFMTAGQKPFFAGTYFPPVSGRGMIGFQELLLTIVKQWAQQRDRLLASADQILSALSANSSVSTRTAQPASDLPQKAAAIFFESFDTVHGGFGSAPKFPLPHNLLFLLLYMTGENGEFFSAQDADSEGKEGTYYTWDYDEICRILGSERGQAFCAHFGITRHGNFEGRNIPNLLHPDALARADAFEAERKRLYEHRKSRTHLHLDDKALTAWNALMICALSALYRVSGQQRFLAAAQKAQSFLDTRPDFSIRGFRQCILSGARAVCLPGSDHTVCR